MCICPSSVNSPEILAYGRNKPEKLTVELSKAVMPREVSALVQDKLSILRMERKISSLKVKAYVPSLRNATEHCCL